MDSNRVKYEKMYKIIKMKLEEKKQIADDQYHINKNSKIQPHMYLQDAEDEKRMKPVEI